MAPAKIIVGLGQCSLDHIAFVKNFPKEDSKEEVLEWVREGGGPAATALVSLSRLGVKTEFIGRVSDDPAGRLIREGLKREGVGTSGLKTRPGGKSQTAFIVVNSGSGERTIFWQRPTIAELKPEEISIAKIKKSSMLLVDGLMRRASIKLVRAAKEAGVPVMLDAGRVRPGMMELAHKADYIVSSEEFALEIAATPGKALKELSRLSPKAATVTLGKRGSLTWKEGWKEGRSFKTPAFKIRAVDTTGAGDVFHGGYIYGLLRGWELERTVEFASALAALKCTRPGGRAGIPTLRRTLKFIRDAKR